ncbi:MAG: Gfo/Idh/MocA family oxidoreductase, partial [Planctomycetes bacterium]|nr:Gfo/Idh/MocA family oxidoreductase [Planctomycetota bacterium]
PHRHPGPRTDRGGGYGSRFEVPKLIKRTIEAGRLGTIVMADAQVKWYRSQEYYDSGAWRGTWDLDGGGALMNQSIHAIDLLQWFMGPVESIDGRIATLGHERIEVEDTAVATLTFANGALGVIEGTTCSYPGFLKRIELCGTRGCIIMEEENLRAWDFAEELPEDAAIRAAYIGTSTSQGGAADPGSISYLGHKMEFADFADAIRTGRPFALDGREARKAVEIIQAIYESSRAGQRIALPLAS